MPEINFFWDPLSDNILQERDETGAVTAEYTAEPGLYGNVISQNRGGVESQFHYDAQGSTLALTDDNQNITDTFAYSAFGEVSERTGTTEVPFQYIGQKGYYTDSVTGQIMTRRRPYEPVRARWLAVDPIDQPFATGTQYSYAANSPFALYDPTGLAPLLVGIDAFECAGCMASQVQWRYDVPPQRRATRFIVVQELTYTEDWTICRPIPCAPPGFCTFGPRTFCTLRVWEHLNVIAVGPVLRDVITIEHAFDIWQHSFLGFGIIGCELLGKLSWTATVRAFPYSGARDPNRDPRAITTDPWKKGAVPCGTTMSYYLTSRPRWWDQHLFEARVRAIRKFDCCNVPATSSWEVSIDYGTPVWTAFDAPNSPAPYFQRHSNCASNSQDYWMEHRIDPGN